MLRVGNLGIRLVTGNITIKSIGFLLTALAPGIFLLALGLVTRQAIGYGDGLMLLVCGLCLGGKTAGVLLITGMFLICPISLYLLLFKRAKRDTQLPFAPFLLGAYLTWLATGA